ncbi:ketopantoate reductase family protein [Sphaerochaeta sp.]|uniref:ketopantoate reductase family protein n=1 Tax=Sphaerochaeta sp. TaxID=1972642 RepID=UPI003D0B24A9
MRIAIYGAGSLGTVLGAYLAKAGVAVDLYSRNEEHIQALRKDGATVVGKVQLQQQVHALLPSEMNGLYDCIFLLTKQLENQKVASFLKPFLADDGMLCTMQNGLPEPQLMEILGKDRVCGCAVGWGATLLGPGVAELTSEADALHFNLGLPTAGREERLDEIATILGNMGPVTIEPNFIGARYSKLLINAAFSGTATALGTTFGLVAQDKKARRIAQLVMKECLDTARAAGIRIEPVQGKDIAKLFDYHSPLKRLVSFALIPLAMKKHASLKPSMLQDIEKGKPCEVDAINGALGREANKAGVATPANDLVVEVIHRIESGELKPQWENIGLFSTLFSK